MGLFSFKENRAAKKADKAAYAERKRQRAEVRQKAADREAATGFAPSEATDAEIAKHKSTDKATLGLIQAAGGTGGMSVNRMPTTMGLTSPLKPSGMQIKSATAGTTPQGMQPVGAPPSPGPNFLGSGPNPTAVNNAMFSIKKRKTSL